MQNKKQTRFIIWMTLAVVWVVVMLLFSGQSADQSSEVSNRVTDLINSVLAFLHLKATVVDNVVRKIAHFVIFAVEGFLLHTAISHKTNRPYPRFAMAFVPCAVLAVLTELEQLFAEGRGCKPMDMLIDACGALVGILLSYLFRRVRSKPKALP